jgi:hypothetical protein
MVGINLGPGHDLAIRLKNLDKATRQLGTRDVLQNASIGAGGLLVEAGGSITIQAPGTLNLGGGVLSVSASFTAGTTITAGTDVDAGGNLNVGGIIRNVAAYSNPITSSFRNLFVTSVDGQYGFNLSSREFKQDIAQAVVDPADVLNLRLVTYRYRQAVAEFGDSAATEYGFIAEEVESAGLGWLVDYDDETGKPVTLKFHLIAMAMLVVAQDQEKRLAALERAAGL